VGHAPVATRNLYVYDYNALGNTAPKQSEAQVVATMTMTVTLGGMLPQWPPAATGASYVASPYEAPAEAHVA